jgi:hypothetical protein
MATLVNFRTDLLHAQLRDVLSKQSVVEENMLTLTGRLEEMEAQQVN